MKIEKFYKILLSDKPSMEIVNNENELFILIPEFKKCRGFNQNNIWHPYDVYQHILHVVDKVDSNIILRLAALFHDIGKPEVYSVDENNVGHFFGHWEKSNDIFLSFAKKCNLDQKTIDSVSKLIYYHDLNISKLDEKDIKKLLSNFSEKELKMLYILKRADLLSQNEQFHDNINIYNEEEKGLLKIKRSK